jgi:NADH-quinone oxidoreductase subunit A
MAQPDYSNFFPYAFFFTLAHVATLIITTVPTETKSTFVMAGIYIIGASLGLYILFRR